MKHKSLFVLFVLIIFITSIFSAIWERNVKLAGFGSLDTTREAYSWRTGIDVYSNLMYGVKTQWITIVNARYEETLERNTKTRGLDEIILHVIYKNYFTRFLYWTAVFSNWTPLSSFGRTIYNESSLCIGRVHTRRLLGEYGLEVNKLFKPDTPSMYWLKVSLLYSTPIGWRGRASMYAQLLPKFNFEEITHFKLYFIIGYNYKFTDKVSIKFDSILWVDSKVKNKAESKATVEILFNIY